MKKLIKVRPMFNKIITTMDSYEDDQRVNGVIDSRRTKGSLKEYQTVIAVGDMVRDIKVGDVVVINPTHYAIKKRDDNSLVNDIEGGNPVLGYRFNTIILNDKECLMLEDRDINFIIEESIDIEEPTGPAIIQPEKPKIIV